MQSSHPVIYFLQCNSQQEMSLTELHRYSFHHRSIEAIIYKIEYRYIYELIANTLKVRYDLKPSPEFTLPLSSSITHQVIRDFTYLSFRQHMTERYCGQLQVLKMWQIFVILSHDSTRSHFVHT